MSKRSTILMVAVVFSVFSSFGSSAHAWDHPAHMTCAPRKSENITQVNCRVESTTSGWMCWPTRPRRDRHNWKSS